jgi:hypothetical protein
VCDRYESNVEKFRKPAAGGLPTSGIDLKNFARPSRIAPQREAVTEFRPD